MAGTPAAVILAGNEESGREVVRLLTSFGYSARVADTFGQFSKSSDSLRIVVEDGLRDEVRVALFDRIRDYTIPAKSVIAVVGNTSSRVANVIRGHNVLVVLLSELIDAVQFRLGQTDGTDVPQHPGADSAVTLGPDEPEDDGENVDEGDDLGRGWKEP